MCNTKKRNLTPGRGFNTKETDVTPKRDVIPKRGMKHSTLRKIEVEY
jgi:hypothetical protein